MLSMWDIIKCVHRNKRIIAFVTLVAVLFGFYYTSNNQSYTSSIIIKYIGMNASKGQTEDGSPLDPYEINNPQVIERALEVLSLSKNSAASVRNHITISPIIPSREEKKDDSILDHAYSQEDAKQYIPVYYKITFVASAGQGLSYARNVLNAIMDQYVQYYSENYLYNADLSEVDSNLSVENYDYIKVVDIVNERIGKISDYIAGLGGSSAKFRSSSTGYNFDDINLKMQYIKDIQIPIIYGEIIEKSVTSNKDYTAKNYLYNSEMNDLAAVSAHQKAEDIKGVMSLYAQKNDVSLWDSPHSPGAEQSQQVVDVYDNNHRKTSVTYDDLMTDYVSFESSSKKAILSKESNVETANIFLNNEYVATPEDVNSVNEKVTHLKKDVSELIGDALLTIHDYNRFLSAQSIQYVSGISVSENLYSTLYILIFGVMGFGLTAVGILAIYIYENVRKECVAEVGEISEDSDNEEKENKPKPPKKTKKTKRKIEDILPVLDEESDDEEIEENNSDEDFDVDSEYDLKLSEYDILKEYSVYKDKQKKNKKNKKEKKTDETEI